MNLPSLISGRFEENFFPFSLTRSVADMRCGILTLREKWHRHVQTNPNIPEGLHIPANCIPDAELIAALPHHPPQDLSGRAKKLLQVPDILFFNASEIENDFKLITAGRHSEPVSPTNKLTGTAIFLEPGAQVEHSYLNASAGPIYIGRNALVMEGAMLRGPVAIGENSIVKMGARIYGATSTGPYCTIGGEIKNSIFFENSNKSHDGYLGDSIIGAWCNIGGGSTNSNLKNSAGPVKLWNPLTSQFIDAGSKFGLLMGDYSRSAIQTAFNTGTVIGVCCHVFGNGLTPAYLSSFSWGFHGERYDFDKALLHIQRWKKLKGHDWLPNEIDRLRAISDQQNKST